MIVVLVCDWFDGFEFGWYNCIVEKWFVVGVCMEDEWDIFIF